jgi:hypothetical protein
MMMACMHVWFAPSDKSMRAKRVRVVSGGFSEH